VDADRLLSVERQLHWSPGELSEERGLRLNRHVLFATEGAAVGHELDLERRLVDTKERGDLPPVIEDALPLAVQPELPLGGRLHDRSFGLEVEMLDPLRRPGSGDDVRALSEGGVNITHLDEGRRKEIVVSGIHLRRVPLEGSFRSENRG